MPRLLFLKVAVIIRKRTLWKWYLIFHIYSPSVASLSIVLILQVKTRSLWLPVLQFHMLLGKQTMFFSLFSDKDFRIKTIPTHLDDDAGGKHKALQFCFAVQRVESIFIVKCMKMSKTWGWFLGCQFVIVLVMPKFFDSNSRPWGNASRDINAAVILSKHSNV